MCTVIDIIDQKRVIVDGPESVTGVRRHMMPLKRLSLTDMSCKIVRGAREKTLKKALAAGVPASTRTADADGAADGAVDEAEEAAVSEILQPGNLAEKLFESCELLKPMKEAFPNLMKDFRAYKNSIPVCGCVLLDPSLTRVVLVCNWAKTSWGLPKGKLKNP